MKRSRSAELFATAKNFIPGGVNSPVRACRSVGCDPLFITRASGSRLYDADDNVYVDFVGSWGPMILGHAHPQVIEAVTAAAALGTSYGAPTPAEIDLAAMVVEALPSVEKVRFVNSGTEATMSAVRLARGYTGKKGIVKFDGCYHGHADSFLVKAGSGVLTLGIPGSPGVPEDIVKNTISIPYNDLGTLEDTLRRHSHDLACVIVEPVAGNMGVVPPNPGFLEGLRQLCSEYGSVMILDEVMTGFRVSKGGAQELYGIKPDLTCLGKVIGGGLPVAAFGGSREIMECLAPVGGVYQAGTLSGNPLAVAAGLATLKILIRDNPYVELERKSSSLEKGLKKILDEKGIPHTINRVASMMSVFFHPGPVENYEQALVSDKQRFNHFFANMLNRGVYLAPSAFEAWFVSAAHSDMEIETTLSAARDSL